MKKEREREKIQGGLCVRCIQRESVARTNALPDRDEVKRSQPSGGVTCRAKDRRWWGVGGACGVPLSLLHRPANHLDSLHSTRGNRPGVVGGPTTKQKGSRESRVPVAFNNTS